MNPRTLERLEAARLIYGRAVNIASAYRCPNYNQGVGGGSNSAHLRGTAVDVARPSGGAALADIIDAFKAAGFWGYGMGKKQGTDTLHFDDDAELGRRAWMY